MPAKPVAKQKVLFFAWRFGIGTCAPQHTSDSSSILVVISPRSLGLITTRMPAKPVAKQKVLFFAWRFGIGTCAPQHTSDSSSILVVISRGSLGLISPQQGYQQTQSPSKSPLFAWRFRIGTCAPQHTSDSSSILVVISPKPRANSNKDTSQNSVAKQKVLFLLGV